MWPTLNLTIQIIPPTCNDYLELLLQGLVLNVVELDNLFDDGEVVAVPEAKAWFDFEEIVVLLFAKLCILS